MLGMMHTSFHSFCSNFQNFQTNIHDIQDIMMLQFSESCIELQTLSFVCNFSKIATYTMLNVIHVHLEVPKSSKTKDGMVHISFHAFMDKSLRWMISNIIHDDLEVSKTSKIRGGLNEACLMS
jgi:hypothetical protein